MIAPIDLNFFSAFIDPAADPTSLSTLVNSKNDPQSSTINFPPVEFLMDSLHAMHTSAVAPSPFDRPWGDYGEAERPSVAAISSEDNMDDEDYNVEATTVILSLTAVSADDDGTVEPETSTTSPDTSPVTPPPVDTAILDQETTTKSTTAVIVATLVPMKDTATEEPPTVTTPLAAFLVEILPADSFPIPESTPTILSLEEAEETASTSTINLSAEEDTSTVTNLSVEEEDTSTVTDLSAGNGEGDSSEAKPFISATPLYVAESLETEASTPAGAYWEPEWARKEPPAAMVSADSPLVESITGAPVSTVVVVPGMKEAATRVTIVPAAVRTSTAAAALTPFSWAMLMILAPVVACF